MADSDSPPDGQPSGYWKPSRPVVTPAPGGAPGRDARIGERVEDISNPTVVDQDGRAMYRQPGRTS